MTDPLVLLPGMMCDWRLFRPQMEALAADTAIFLPPIWQAATVEDIARQVLAGAPPRFALAGLSMGGIIAMEVLRQAPDRVSRLALMDTNCQAELPAVAAAREPQIVRVQTGRMEEVIRDEMKPNYLAPGPGRAQVLDLVMEMALSLGEAVFLRQSRALQRRPDQQGTLRKSATPTLVLCGELDTLCPVRRHEFIAHLMPNAALQVIPEAGHLPTLERPEIVTDLLNRWLSAPDGTVFS